MFRNGSIESRTDNLGTWNVGTRSSIHKRGRGLFWTILCTLRSIEREALWLPIYLPGCQGRSYRSRQLAWYWFLHKCVAKIHQFTRMSNYCLQWQRDKLPSWRKRATRVVEWVESRINSQVSSSEEYHMEVQSTCSLAHGRCLGAYDQIYSQDPESFTRTTTCLWRNAPNIDEWSWRDPKWQTADSSQQRPKGPGPPDTKPPVVVKSQPKFATWSLQQRRNVQQTTLASGSVHGQYILEALAKGVLANPSRENEVDQTSPLPSDRRSSSHCRRQHPSRKMAVSQSYWSFRWKGWKCPSSQGENSHHNSDKTNHQTVLLRRRDESLNEETERIRRSTV